jgi:glucose-6-phosphate 1-dehydrogenase
MKPKLDLVIFGGTGDLSTRKLLPALFQLHRHQLADRLHRIIGTGRSSIPTEQFRDTVRANLQTFLPAGHWSEEVWNSFRERLHYSTIHAGEPEDYLALGELLDAAEAPGRLYYLATLPSLYGEICRQLHSAGIVNEHSGVVLEKPLGHDLESCREINEQVARVFGEEDTFRIDHYLGKETVQNLLAVRFGNPLFSPMWRNTFVDNVQITVAEERKPAPCATWCRTTCCSSCRSWRWSPR